MSQFGSPRRHLSQCGSTNDLARAWALDSSDPAPPGALVTADFQTQGRGRRGRAWTSGIGQSALMSFVLRPQISPAEASQLAFLAALAVADALEALGLEARLKWPNDVLVNSRKIAGVLVETVLSPGEGAWAAIVGMGVNVAQERFADSESYIYPPTSLRLETGHAPDVSEVISAVSRSLEKREAILHREGFSAILSACRERLAVDATVRRGESSAILLGLNADGGAHVRLPDGTFEDWTTVEG